MSGREKIAHGLAGGVAARQSSQRRTSQSEEERRPLNSRPTTTTTSVPLQIDENSRSSSFEEPTGLVEDYFYFSEEDEEQDQEEPSDPFSKDPSSFLFVPGIQAGSRKEGEKTSSESSNFGLDTFDTSTRREEEFGRKIDSGATAVVKQQSRFQPQGLNSPGISFNEAGESNLFDVLSQLDL